MCLHPMNALIILPLYQRICSMPFSPFLIFFYACQSNILKF
uniref:Uncharacterized protein n=1 Tax=Arundo donax TaxID=35708 RepID=A0A0A9C2E4_ARUDO